MTEVTKEQLEDALEQIKRHEGRPLRAFLSPMQAANRALVDGFRRTYPGIMLLQLGQLGEQPTEIEE